MATVRRSVRLSSQVKPSSAHELMPPPSSSSNGIKRKAPSISAQSSEPYLSAPATPPKRRQRAPADAKPPPLTPTPSAVGLIAEGHQNTLPSTPSPRKKPTSKAVARLADADITNAPLVSPESSRIVASRRAESLSPSKLPSSAATATTTANLLEVANKHLVNVDERMKPLVEGNHCRIFSPEGLAETIDPFEALASGIISQQVSGAAAKAIKNKFIALFDLSQGPDSTTAQRFPHPSQVMAVPLERLRTAGLSQRKAEYVSGLAEKFQSGELSTQMLHDAPYEEVLEKLIAVRGLGRWSVEMFACFALKRTDVFSTGDLGVQRGMAAFVGRDVAKLRGKGGKWKYMSEKEMEEMAEKFRPYRTLFMWYMWRVEETDVSTME